MVSTVRLVVAIFQSIVNAHHKRQQLLEELKPKAPPKPEPELTAPPAGATGCEILRWEHRRIERHICRMREALAPCEQEIERARAEFEILASLWAPHTGKERRVLFPRVAELFGAKVSELEQQHSQLDETVARLAELFRQPAEARPESWPQDLRTLAREWAELLHRHVIREEDGLLREVDRETPFSERLEMGQDMQRQESSRAAGA